MSEKNATSKILEQLKVDIVESNICPELAQEATHLVMGDGDENADVVFIGEAPGKNEDLKGKPFIGAAGKFLDEMLNSIGMQRSGVYITNIVKYRPPNNRDPLPEEKQDFWPYLTREIQAVSPKIIATLGKHSMEYFLPKRKISQIHGQPKRIEFGGRKIVILPLYHPASALYNGGMRQTLLEDFQSIPKILKKLN